MRGLDKVFGVTSANSTFGCFFCWLKGFKRAGKEMYCGHHVYLPLGHWLREKMATYHTVPGMPDRSAESTKQPMMRSNEDLRKGMSSMQP